MHEITQPDLLGNSLVLSYLKKNLESLHSILKQTTATHLSGSILPAGICYLQVDLHFFKPFVNFFVNI